MDDRYFAELEENFFLIRLVESIEDNIARTEELIYLAKQELKKTTSKKRIDKLIKFIKKVKAHRGDLKRHTNTHLDLTSVFEDVKASLKIAKQMNYTDLARKDQLVLKILKQIDQEQPYSKISLIERDRIKAQKALRKAKAAGDERRELYYTAVNEALFAVYEIFPNDK